MANKGNVTVGKPLVAGAVYRTPVGTTLPTAADATLDGAFIPVGYISEEGLRWSYSGDGDVIRAWGRDVVSRPAGVVDDVASFQMLETVNEEAVKAFWGDDARSVITGGYALQVGVPSPVQYSWVIDMLLPTNPDPMVLWPSPRVRRIVIPAASVRDREEISYQDSELVAYGVSLKASKSFDTHLGYDVGVYHFEYAMGAVFELTSMEPAYHGEPISVTSAGLSLSYKTNEPCTLSLEYNNTTLGQWETSSDFPVSGSGFWTFSQLEFNASGTYRFRVHNFEVSEGEYIYEFEVQ